MIEVRNVSKGYQTQAGRKLVLDQVNLSVRSGERVGILGRNGAGKSTMIRLISGAEQPDSGEIVRSMTCSWPLAFGGAFQYSLSGLDNLRFICRIYGTSFNDKVEYVEDFAELGQYLYEPVRTYSAGMRARLAFAISMVVEFDCFLIDEVVAVGDARFYQKCHDELFVKRADRAMIIVSHDDRYIREHCTRASVISDNRLNHFGSVDDALCYYRDC